MTYDEKIEMLRRKVGGEVVCFGVADTIAGISAVAKNAAMGGSITTPDGDVMPKGNGRTVTVLRNPVSGKREAWGRAEGSRDRETRFECEPRFNTADQYATVSTLEAEKRKPVVRIAREDRCVVALADAQAADEAEAEAALAEA